MTKAEKLRRARIIRKHVAGFIDRQDNTLREHIRSEWRRDPDYSAMNQLLNARNELTALIADLQKEGYGQ
jgi:hypothetical protein